MRLTESFPISHPVLFSPVRSKSFSKRRLGLRCRGTEGNEVVRIGTRIGEWVVESVGHLKTRNKKNWMKNKLQFFLQRNKSLYLSSFFRLETIFFSGNRTKYAVFFQSTLHSLLFQHKTELPQLNRHLPPQSSDDLSLILN